MVLGQAANMTFNFIMEGLKLQVFIYSQCKEITFVDLTVKIFSFKNAITGHKKSFFCF